MKRYLVFFMSLGLYCGSFLYLYIFSFSHLPYFGLVNLLFFLNQAITSFLNHRSNKSLLQNTIQHKIILLVIGYRENIIYWKHCLEHILQLNPQAIHHIYISIDGNDPEDQYMIDHVHILLEHSSIPFSVIALSHDGKRNALYKSIHFIRSQYPFHWQDYLLAVTDSDTLLAPSSLQHLAQCLEHHEQNGCVTGLLEIFNLSSSFLCRIVNTRYLYAFAIERGSQSFFGTMTCCSGPISMFRLSLLDEQLLESFYNQSFFHYLSETGDDRHLTNLILTKGFYSKQISFSTAKTECPETLTRFLLQQIRWIRSYYRELYWQFKAIHSVRSLSFSISMIRDFSFNYMLIFVLLHTLFFSPNLLLFCIIFISAIAMTFLRCLLLFLYFQTFSCFLYFCYIPIYFCLLLPVHIYCLFSFCNSQWLTSYRKRSNNDQRTPLDIIFSSIFICVWNISIVSQIIHLVISSCKHPYIYKSLT